MVHLVKFVSFMNKVMDAKPNRLVADPAFWSIFHATTPEGHQAYLDSKKLSVFHMAVALHVIMTGVGAYSEKADAECTFYDSSSFKGEVAIKECVLLLLLAGEDPDRTHYTMSEGKWTHNAAFAHCVAPVPGIGLSQLDSRNQEALAFVHTILKGVSSDERPSKCPVLTAKGLFKDIKSPTDFFCAPVFMDGWPKPKYAGASKFLSCPAGSSFDSTHRIELPAAPSPGDEDDDEF